jgi:hypothetical protein
VDKLQKITSISELQSPDRQNSPTNHNQVKVNLVQQQLTKKSNPNAGGISNDPYSNVERSNSSQQEFHYSGSFGVPQTFVSTFNNKNEDASQSMIH